MIKTLSFSVILNSAVPSPMNVAKRQKYGQRFEWKIVKKSLFERSNSTSCFRRGEGGQQFVTANTKKK